MFNKVIPLLICLLVSKLYSSSEANKHTLFWIDLEMTGLSPEKDLIVQSAAIVTDDNLNIIAECPERIIHHALLPEMDPFVVAMHTKSGLLEKIKVSENKLGDVEEELITFCTTHCKSKGTQLCGNSIWKDRAFLEKQMPRFVALFHHQMIDVSSIGGVAWRWYPEECKQFKKEKKHTSQEDILQSIAELKYFKENIFKNKHD